MSQPPVILVAPVFEDRTAVECLIDNLAKDCSLKIELFLVDDGSSISPLMKETVFRANFPIRIVRLRRNVGHQTAIAVGVHYIHNNCLNYEYIVTLDSDGEDQPKHIMDLVSELRTKGSDVVVARRKLRSNTVAFKIFHNVYKFLFLVLTGKRMDFGNFMAFTPRSICRIVTMPEFFCHCAAAVLQSRLDVARCPLDRGNRYDGQSKMGFSGLALHGFRSFVVFSEIALTRIATSCAIFGSLVLVCFIAAVVLKLIGFATPGWFSIVLGILSLMLIQTATITLFSLLLVGMTSISNSINVVRRINLNEIVEEVMTSD
ncbi:glycosyltransferase [Alphaproteobacteria bacterium]|nr:glycosyltransferase [Alphaproteobacteria bacterium]